MGPDGGGLINDISAITFVIHPATRARDMRAIV